MNLTSLAITHRLSPHDFDKHCTFRIFGVKSGNKLWVEHETYDHKKEAWGEPVAVEYDLSHIITGITYRHATQTESTLIESMVTHDGKHLDIVLFPTHTDIYAVHFDTITDTYQYKEGERDVPHTPKAVADHTIVFPTAETNDQWKDRMKRLLSAAAHNFEAAMGSLYSQFYTRSLDAATAPRSTAYLNREVNTAVHCRTQIGYLWKQVSKGVKAVEADVLALYENMKEPQAVKAFFHNHSDNEWQKLRYSTGDNRSHRRVHLWNDDFTAGKLLRDVNAAHTGDNADLEAKAEYHILATSEYEKAAASTEWQPITERVY